MSPQKDGSWDQTRPKNSIGAVSGAGGVAGNDPEMNPGAAIQARNGRKNVLIITSGSDLVRRARSVADGRAILEVNGCAQSMRIQPAIEPR